MLCAEKGEVDQRPWELTSGPHLSGGPARLLTFELKPEVVKLWVLAREGGWRKGCPMPEGPDLTQEPDSLEKLKELRGWRGVGKGVWLGKKGEQGVGTDTEWPFAKD